MTESAEMNVTCPDVDTAGAIGRAAIAARLAACANVFGPVTSVFHWDGAVEEEVEALLTLKTRSGCVEALIRLIREAHPYEVPAITWTVVDTDAETATWIATETGAAP